MTNKIVVLITAGSKAEAENIAESIIGQNLAACVNIVDSIQSIFNWEKKVCKEPEVLMIAKTVASNLNKLIAEVKTLHSYDVPEIIALPIIAGSPEYLTWIDNETDRQTSD